MDLTYKILGADGNEYGPATLDQLKGWINEGRVTASTHIERSDQQNQWLTAASYPELGLQAQATPAPKSAATDLDQYKLHQRFKSGASWFYWIAGLSVINSAMALSGTSWRLIVGLGITQIIDAFAKGFGSSTGMAIAIVLDALVAGLFILFGVFAGKGHTWSFLVGMILYALDGAIFLLGPDWLALGFHVFVLFCIFSGFKACQQLRASSA
jgi:uncharacterized protein DUF4339